MSFYCPGYGCEGTYKIEPNYQDEYEKEGNFKFISNKKSKLVVKLNGHVVRAAKPRIKPQGRYYVGRKKSHGR